MTLAGVAQARSLRNVMELTPELIESATSAVFEPSMRSFLWLLSISLLGEAFIQLPTSILFASPLLFLNEPISLVFSLKLLSLVAFPIAIGTTIGSYVAYGIAYFGGKPAIEKLKKWIRFSWEDVEKMEAKFKDKWYDELVFLAFRSLPLTPTVPLSVLAGVLRMNFTTYTLLTLLGVTIRMAIMLFVFSMGEGNALIEILDL